LKTVYDTDTKGNLEMVYCQFHPYSAMVQALQPLPR